LKKIVVAFPEMLAGEIGHEKHENSQRELAKPFPTAERVEKFRKLLIQLKQGEPVEKEAGALVKELLASDLPLYCGDIMIEYRPGNLKYESLRRLQQDSRLPSGLNTVGNIRVIAGSLEILNNKEN